MGIPNHGIHPNYNIDHAADRHADHSHAEWSSKLQGLQLAEMGLREPWRLHIFENAGCRQLTELARVCRHNCTMLHADGVSLHYGIRLLHVKQIRKDCNYVNSNY